MLIYNDHRTSTAVVGSLSNNIFCPPLPTASARTLTCRNTPQPAFQVHEKIESANSKCFTGKIPLFSVVFPMVGKKKCIIFIAGCNLFNIFFN